MKALLCAFLTTSLLSFQTTSPVKLAGTSWQGKAMLPDSTYVIMKFTDSSLSFYETKNAHRLLGTVTYEQIGSFICIHAGTGFSPCLKKGNWTYSIESNQSVLNFIVIDGPCDVNGSALVKESYLPAVEINKEK